MLAFPSFGSSKLEIISDSVANGLTQRVLVDYEQREVTFYDWRGEYTRHTFMDREGLRRLLKRHAPSHAVFRGSY